MPNAAISAGMTRVHLSRPPFAAAPSTAPKRSPGLLAGGTQAPTAAITAPARRSSSLDVDAEQRARHDAEMGERGIAPAEIGIGAKHPAEVLPGRELVELGPRVGDHGELLGPPDPVPEEGEMGARLQRAAGFRGEHEQRLVGRQLLGVAMDGAGIAGVQDPEVEATRADPERLAQHLREQAGAAHAAPQHMGEAVVLQLLREGQEILDLLLHLMGRHQPADPIGDLGRVAVPQGVVERPDAPGRPAPGQIGLGGIGRGRSRTEELGAAIARLAQGRGLGLDALQQLREGIVEGVAPLDLQLVRQGVDVDAGLRDLRDHRLGGGGIRRQERADAAVPAERQQGRLGHGVDGVRGGERA